MRNSNPGGFKNRAGATPGENDKALIEELHQAGIQTAQEVEGFPDELLRLLRSETDEVVTSSQGLLHGWTFTRSWNYWVAEGPGIDFERAMNLWISHGTQARVGGDCACRSPAIWFKGLACGHYHVDTPEGLRALADTIKAQVAHAESVYPQHVMVPQ